MKNTIKLSCFEGKTTIERFSKAAEWLRVHPGTTLVMDPGVYEIATPLAQQTMSEALSGAYGENPQNVMFTPDFVYSTGFLLEGMEKITLSAYGALLMVDGFMEPIAIRNSRNITVEGLTIDHKRKPFSMGVVSDVQWQEKEKGSFCVQFGADYPTCPQTPMPRLALYDPYASRFVGYGEYRIIRREWLEGNCWRFSFEGMRFNPVGMECYVWHAFHSRPAIRIEEAQNICLRDVTIHSQPGMGVVAHRSSDLLLSSMRVVPSAGVHMSTNTDATHFTSCKGTVRIENSVFEGQGDDSVNIHTYYHTIREADGCSSIVELEAPDGTHTQSPDVPDAGDLLELTDLNTLACTGTYRVLAAEQITHRTSRLLLDQPLPENCLGFAFANASQTARFEFCNNLCRNHIARSVLVKVKNALIENNTIMDATGTGIFVAAEAEWREGLCTTQDIVIRRNRIVNCGRANSSGRKNDSGGICVTVDAENAIAPTHASVIICDNIIDCPEAPYGIYVSNIAKLVLERNDVNALQEPVILA